MTESIESEFPEIDYQALRDDVSQDESTSELIDDIELSQY